MEQQELRDKTRLLHEKYGVSYAFLSRYMGISTTYFCLWLKGDRTFSNGKAEKLNSFVCSIKLEGE